MKPGPKPKKFAALIGIDWADRKHDTCLGVPGQEKVELDRIEHKPAVLNEWVAALRKRFGGRPVAIAVEQSRGGLIHSLMQHDFLVLYIINPATCAKFRQAWKTSRAKDDPTDAQLLMEILRTHRNKLRPWRPHDPTTRKMALLCEHRRKAVSLRVKLTNELVSSLKAFYPLALEVAGDKLNSSMALNFLTRWPTLEKVKRARPSTLRQFYYRLNSRYPQTIEARIQKVREAEPLTTDAILTEVYSRQVQMLVEQLKTLQKSIAEYDREISSLYAEHQEAELFSSFPGSGKTFAPRLASAFGTDRDRYEAATELQNFVGVAPVTERSGKGCWVHRRWACPRFLRQSFHEYAAESIRHSMWARAWYAQARDRGMGHHAAVRMLAYKWIRIMFRCWKDRTPYDELQYLTALKKRNSSLWKTIAEHPEGVKYAF